MNHSNKFLSYDKIVFRNIRTLNLVEMYFLDEFLDFTGQMKLKL